jgi:glutamate synthase domain-containing protein 2/glutamate synthase domain-containing protein 1/glutamate synthase domain-containing protein 3
MEPRVQPSSDHDACGVGFIAHARGRAGRDIVAHGLSALRRLTHRGAEASLGAVDGCGVLTAIPWTWIVDAFGGRLPAARTRGLGMLFVHPSDRLQGAEIVERELRLSGARSIDWRIVPTDRAVVLRARRDTTPTVLQVVGGFDDGRQATDAALYRARLRIERIARAAGVRLTIVSLSTRTVVHKALVTPDALDRFFPDLADARFISPFITFHQRFSTNTSADWALAQPFRTLAHNGEINTIAGNRLWMRARSADATSLPGFSLDPPISTHGSDSLSLDDAIEMLRHNGYSLAHAVTRLVPPAWERDRDLPPDVRAFYEFQALVSEPWDGPSALVFADGRYVGAALDRNGFRPARIVATADDLIAVASEVGVLPADEHEIVNRARLGPGDMIVVDVERGSVMGTNEIHRRLAFRRRYRDLVADVLRPLAEPVALDAAERAADRGPAKAGPHVHVSAEPHPNLSAEPVELSRRQAAFGCTREEIELLLKPMITEGHEAVGSMGDDAPPAALSQRPRLFGDFFRQRFAQVTNPSVDPYRESSVMSLTTLLGGHGSFIDELAPRPPRIVLRSPILSRRDLDQLAMSSALQPVTIDIVFPACGGVETFDVRLRTIADEACAAVERGSALVILTDRWLSADAAAVPALLAQAAVHHALVTRGLRMRASIVVETGDARDAHHLGLLFGYGASAVCPSLGYDTIASLADTDPTGCDVAITRYRLALERGLRTLMSKMGVCTFSGYCGAQLFEILGLHASLVDRFFPGTASPIGGADLADIAATVLARHRRAFAETAPAAEYPGLHGFRRGGEYHATNPVIVRGLQKARDEALTHTGGPAYETFKSHVYGRPPQAIRDLIELTPSKAAAPAPLEQVESVEAICRRFFASAMSVGALSPETHRTIATAMNRLGARSNSGEGGEEPDRFARPTHGDWDGSRTKQVASARFGVTPAYLRSADELQIKIAQGSKPGEGGQLPGMKVIPHIARLRHAQPGTTLISPPVHHDIYSIEDLAELIYDLRAFHPTARMNVKLVASVGVGIIATGVAKAGADAIQISGHDGGTGASPRASIKHAGMPWEIGLSEAHHALTRAGLRGRVVLQTDGGLKTGRDIAIAAALGAQEYGFGTAALVALGCVMARQCHANTCPVGIATQRADLRADFAGTADMLVGYLKLIAGEVREILASLGLTRLEDLIGRADLLRRREGVVPSLSLDRLLASAIVERPLAPNVERGLPSLSCRPGPFGPGISAGPKGPALHTTTTPSSELLDTISPDHPLSVTGPIANTDRAYGAGIAGAIAARFGDRGLPDGSVQLAMTGSAGQSFGAFALPGMRLSLIGDTNDGLGKGMHGGEIVVAPAARERGRADQVLAGNAALYGATGGRLFVAGLAGERFAIRNSGATAVVEGVGDHACEYMTGGTVVVLGPVGQNLAAGMTGGVIYVAANRESLAARTHPQHLAIDAPTVAEQKVLRELLEAHERLTGSRVARSLLRFDRHLAGFCRITPVMAAVVTSSIEIEAEPVAQAG